MRPYREYAFVILIVVLIFGLSLYLTNKNKIEVVTDIPQKQNALPVKDFVVNIETLAVHPGQDYDEIIKMFPSGHTLGMSTVYCADDMELLFTFSKKENILIKVDIMEPNIHTARGIGVGDSEDKLLATYGQGYTLVYDKKRPHEQEFIYGMDHYIVFKLKDKRIDKIVLDCPL
ncbi:MAG TPA: hypothetical protein GX404_08570 [Syntrophomonadaceae bacterium]|nr:hypothetical protein [Syntrophomonadaceae bacterium]